MADLIIAAIFLVLSIICLVYAVFTWNYRGPILMNKYLLACDEEKRSLAGQPDAERKADYRYVSKLAFAISFLWITVVLDILLDPRFIWLTGVTSAFLVIYAFYSLFKHNRD